MRRFYLCWTCCGYTDCVCLGFDYEYAINYWMEALDREIAQETNYGYWLEAR